jgi:ATP-dependent DNA helicase RecG
MIRYGIDRIWELINRHNANVQIASAAYIFPVLTFNESVIREAVLNAIAHRDYAIGSEVVIKQFPKKIAIINPGGFPKGVTLDNLLFISSTPRSRLMAEVLEKTGLVERSGQGVDKIFSLTLSEGKPEPDYRDSNLYQVALKLDGNIVDKAFYSFIGQMQRKRDPLHQLGVEEIITLHKVKQGMLQQSEMKF